MTEEKKQTIPRKAGNIPSAFVSGLLSVPAEIVGAASEFFANINQSGIKEWVAENVKSLKDLIILGKTAIAPTEKSIKSTTTYFEQRAKEKMKEEIEPESIDLSKFQITSLPAATGVSTAATTIPVGATKEELAQRENIETMQKVRAEFNNLVQRGFFRDNPEQSFHLLSPLLQVMVKSPNGQIPSWFLFANWQINYLDESVDALRLAQMYSEELQKRGINMDVGDVLDGIHARTFDDIYLLSRQGILNFILPDTDISKIKDTHQKYLTERWIASVYRGYKLMKKEPPPEIKILYSSLTKGKSAAGMLETGIYSTAQDIQQETGETSEIPTEEIATETEPEVSTIQTQFLRK
jgi:hypothetical protein